MKKKIAIIVPVYKAEKYIDRCINSILTQSLQEFELVLVDDGSPDNSPEICDAYAKQDNRIKVIHKKNGGVSSARNEGIRLSTAEYITFIDSDDYVSKDYLKHLVEAGDADYVAGGYNREKPDGSWEKHNFNAAEIRMGSVKNEPELITKIPMGMVTIRVYKKSIIERNKLKFSESIRRGEDFYFNTMYLSCCDTVKVISDTDYYYRYNEVSATNMFEKNLFKWSMKSVCQIGTIIGTKDELFKKYVWNNAEYVINDHLNYAKGKGIFEQLRVVKALIGVCCNKLVRRSLKYAPTKKMQVMIFTLVFSLVPIVQNIKK